MTCNYNNNLPHIQIRSHPKSKIGQFFILESYNNRLRKVKNPKQKKNTKIQNQSHKKSATPGDSAPSVSADRARNPSCSRMKNFSFVNSI